MASTSRLRAPSSGARTTSRTAIDRSCADPRKSIAARWITAFWVALDVRAASIPRAMYTLYMDMPSNITMTRPKPAIRRWLIFHVCIGFYLGGGWLVDTPLVQGVVIYYMLRVRLCRVPGLRRKIVVAIAAIVPGKCCLKSDGLNIPNKETTIYSFGF